MAPFQWAEKCFLIRQDPVIREKSLTNGKRSTKYHEYDAIEKNLSNAEIIYTKYDGYWFAVTD